MRSKRLGELVQKAGLANTGLAANGDDLSPALLDLAEAGVQHGKFFLPTYERAHPP
jgi:hypothetical protein